MSYCVLEQICKQLRQQFAVASHPQLVVDISLQLLALFLQRRAVNLENRAQHIAQINFAKTCLARAALDLRNAQQRAKNFENAIHIASRGIEHRAESIRIDTVFLRKLKSLPQTRERGTQIM